MTASPLKTFGRAIGDALLRTLIIVGILMFGYWIPSTYLHTHFGIFSQFGCGPLADAAFSLAKAAALVYGAVALWKLRRAAAVFWSAYPESDRPNPKGLDGSSNRAGVDAG